MDTYRDYLGSIIMVGDRGIKVDGNSVTYAPFKKFTVTSIDGSMSDPIQILVDRSKRKSRVSPQCIISGLSLVKKLDKNE